MLNPLEPTQYSVNSAQGMCPLNSSSHLKSMLHQITLLYNLYSSFLFLFLCFLLLFATFINPLRFLGSQVRDQVRNKHNINDTIMVMGVIISIIRIIGLNMCNYLPRLYIDTLRL